MYRNFDIFQSTSFQVGGFSLTPVVVEWSGDLTDNPVTKNSTSRSVGRLWVAKVSLNRTIFLSRHTVKLALTVTPCLWFFNYCSNKHRHCKTSLRTRTHWDCNSCRGENFLVNRNLGQFVSWSNKTSHLEDCEALVFIDQPTRGVP